MDGKLISMDPDVHEVSNTYNSSDGGQMTVLWQQYRPLLGDTTELSTGAAPPDRVQHQELNTQSQSYRLSVD